MNSPAPHARAEQLEIDASARWPVVAFFAAALGWLIVGGALQLLGSIQLHTPAFLAGCEWFTHGRVVASAQNALVYGWGMNAGLGFALWLMARLSAAPLRHGGWLLVACKFWNVAVFLGVVGIHLGASTSFELLEMPRFVAVLLLAAYALIGVWAVTTFSVRNTEEVYASQWYLLGALFWFPWLYAVAQLMLFQSPVQGVLQALVGAWYVHGLLGLWFIPLALAAAYYFLPKLTGRPIARYYLAPLGFWWLVLTTAFAGGSRLLGGPVPAWVATLGAVANFLLVVAVVIIAVNLLGTLRGGVRSSYTLRFIALSVAGFLGASALNFALSLRSFAVTAQFTFLPELRDWVILYACFSTAMFGAAYFILPRVTGRAWPSTALLAAHWLATVLGVVVLIAGLAWAGWQEGRWLNDASVPFADAARALAPWHVFRSLALMVLTTGHLAFLINFVRIACPLGGADLPQADIHAPAALEAPHA